jgi:putative membrane protein
VKRSLSVTCLAGGVVLATWLVASTGLPAVGAALRAVGVAGLLAVLAIHLVATALMGTAWWLLRRAGRPGVFVWGRLVRDGGSEVLPLSQVGGLMLAARVLVADGVATAVAVATTLVDATVEFLAQIGYLVLGLLLLARVAPGRAPALSIWLPLGVAVATVVALATLRGGLPRAARAAPARQARPWLAQLVDRLSAVRREILEIARFKTAVALAFVLHFTAWIVSGVEAWLALRFMGVALGLPAVLAIESLVYGTRSLAFMVPTAIGIQEGAYVILGAALGLGPEFALGLSLLKRGRDLALGIPALASWQLLEARRAGAPARADR